jgi:hypothetical protein
VSYGFFKLSFRRKNLRASMRANSVALPHYLKHPVKERALGPASVMHALGHAPWCASRWPWPRPSRQRSGMQRGGIGGRSSAAIVVQARPADAAFLFPFVGLAAVTLDPNEDADAATYSGVACGSGR